jgi:hypothetical protein
MIFDLIFSKALCQKFADQVALFLSLTNVTEIYL